MKHKLSDATILTEADIERIVGEIAQIDANQASTQRSIDQLLNDRDAAIDAIREEYADALTTLGEKARNFEAMRDAKLAFIKTWAAANKEKFFDKKRSFSFQRGTVGFNLSKPKLDIVDGESFESAAAKLRRLRGGKPFVELKPVLRKADILKMWPTLGALFARAGLVRVQEDDFYFKPVEQAPDSLKAAA